jgi:hypothetical protein
VMAPSLADSVPMPRQPHDSAVERDRALAAGRPSP